MAVKYFAHDDSPFESWLKEHPDGYVLNFYTTATGKVNSGRCPSYQVAGPRMTTSRLAALPNGSSSGM